MEPLHIETDALHRLYYTVKVSPIILNVLDFRDENEMFTIVAGTVQVERLRNFSSNVPRQHGIACKQIHVK